MPLPVKTSNTLPISTTILSGTMANTVLYGTITNNRKTHYTMKAGKSRNLLALFSTGNTGGNCFAQQKKPVPYRYEASKGKLLIESHCSWYLGDGQFSAEAIWLDIWV